MENNVVKDYSEQINKLLHIANDKNKTSEILAIISEIPRYSLIPSDIVLKNLNDIANNSYFQDGEMDYSAYESMVSIAQSDLDEIVKSDEQLLNALLHSANKNEMKAEIFNKIRRLPKYYAISDDIIIKHLNNIANNSYFQDGEMDYLTYESMVSIAQSDLDEMVLNNNNQISK